MISKMVLNTMVLVYDDISNFCDAWFIFLSEQKHLTEFREEVVVVANIRTVYL